MPPDPAKLAALREFLRGIEVPGLALAKGQVIRPQHFNAVLRHAKDTPYAAMINQLVLRSQSPGGLLAARISATSAWRSGATPISPRRSGAMPTCSCTAP